MPTLAPPDYRSTTVDRIVVEQLNNPTLRIDRELGVIRGCKIAGFSSGNRARVLGLTREQFGPAIDRPYRYSRRAFEQALSLYEGARVYSNHLPFAYNAQGERFMAPPDTRVNESLIGWFSNVKLGDDGIYGDFNYVKAHNLAPIICEVAERNPEIFKFSHEARWDEPTVENGQVVLNKIKAVDGIALVCVNAGTTQSLFESLAIEGTETMPRTMRQVLESMAEETPGRKALMEMISTGSDYQSMGEAPIEAAPEMSIEEQLLVAFEGALLAVWRDKKLDTQAKISKIKDLFKGLEKVSGEGSSTTSSSSSGETSGEGKAEESEDKKAQEALANSADAALWASARNGAPLPTSSGTPQATGAATLTPAQGSAVVDRSPVVMESVALLVGAGLSELAGDQRVIESLVGQPDKANREAYVKTLAGLRAPAIVARSTPAAPVVTAPATQRVAESAATPVPVADMAAIMRGAKPI